jgi:hypothetical protein
MRRELVPRVEPKSHFRAAVLLSVRAFLIVTALLSVTGASAGAEISLSVQGCNTRCQSVQTDCVLRCDGDIPCIQQCQKAADSCVDQCRSGKAPGPATGGKAPRPPPAAYWDTLLLGPTGPRAVPPSFSFMPP